MEKQFYKNQNIIPHKIFYNNEIISYKQRYKNYKYEWLYLVTLNEQDIWVKGEQVPLGYRISKEKEKE